MRGEMNLPTTYHEAAIVRHIADGTSVHLETALLVLAGLETPEAIRSYESKIDTIFSRYLSKDNNRRYLDQSRPPSYLHRAIAKSLFEYLWNSKPKRFGEHFLLTHVVDAQLNTSLDLAVGTCIGLTSLYSVLGLRLGLNLSLLMNLDHVRSRLRVGHQVVDIDHTDPQGFDATNPDGFREFPLLTLLANVLNSRGLQNESNNQLRAARTDYEKAVLVNPEYANAYNNRGSMKFRDADLTGAIADYTEAIRHHPHFCEAYCNRGMAYHKLGRYNEARLDYRMAMATNPDYQDARTCLQLLEAVDRPKPLPAIDSNTD